MEFGALGTHIGDMIGNGARIDLSLDCCWEGHVCYMPLLEMDKCYLELVVLSNDRRRDMLRDMGDINLGNFVCSCFGPSLYEVSIPAQEQCTHPG